MKTLRHVINKLKEKNVTLKAHQYFFKGNAKTKLFGVQMLMNGKRALPWQVCH
jgi:hypothetical protein